MRDDEMGYVDPPKPKTTAEIIDGIIQTKTIPTRPAVHHRLTEDEIDLDFPEEYRGAEILPVIREALLQRPLCMMLHGPPGTGKTRQGWAIARYDRLLRAKAMMVDGEVIDANHYEEYRMRHRPHWVDAKLIELSKADRVKIITEAGDIRAHRFKREVLDEWAAYRYTLIVDDIGFMEPSDWVREAIYHLANERRSHGRRTVWTSNLDQEGLKSMFSAAIASRLTAGTVIEVDGQDRRA
jgi:hypothetical protein